MFEFYRNFELESEMEKVKNLFDQHSIEFEATSVETIIDEVFVGKGMIPKFTIKLKTQDFKRASEILKKQAENEMDLYGGFEHLNELTDEELTEIVLKPYEWSIESEIAAKKILKARGVEISEQEIKDHKFNFQREFFKGKSVHIGIQLAYFVAIILGFYIHIVFIIAGLGMGYYYAYGKTTDREGNRYYLYDKRAREIGKFIFVGGIIAFVIQLYLLYR